MLPEALVDRDVYGQARKASSKFPIAVLDSTDHQLIATSREVTIQLERLGREIRFDT
jgi:hypothetical protein